MFHVVRKATLDDVDTIGNVHYQAHIETYSDKFPVGIIEGFPAEQRAQLWRRVLSRASADLWVAEADEQIVGFASAGPSRDDPPARKLELSSIYLLAAHHGSGLGQELLDAALGERPASLWVLDHNPRAHAFYARNGFTADGAERIDKDFGNVREIRMVR